jgi:hypothetical protein
MLKIYKHPETGYRKGNFKVPEKQIDMNLDCSLHQPSDALPTDGADDFDDNENY